VVDETPFGAIRQKTIKIGYFFKSISESRILLDKKGLTKESQMSYDEKDLLQETKRDVGAFSPRVGVRDAGKLSGGR
jgi:hypothetical protein